MRGVGELGRPLLIQMWQIFQNNWPEEMPAKPRGLHARCAQISRATRNRIFLCTVFIGGFSKKSVGIGGAKELVERVLTVSVLL